MSEFFGFEDESVDFPFYNNIPKLSESEWFSLILGLGLFTFLLVGPVIVPLNVFSLLLFFVLAIPTLYALKRNVTLLFKKPKRSDIKLIVLCLVGYYIYAIIILSIFEFYGFTTNSHALVDINIDEMFWITMFFQLMGEELFKIIILLLILYISYSLTKNRKFSLICATFVTLMAFGLAHYGAYGNLIQIIAIQGFGSIFEIYPYLKTKNILVPYALHIIIDAIPLILTMIVN